MSSKPSKPEAQLNLGDIHSYDYPVTYGEPGSYMDVAARTHYLLIALDSISQRNIRGGFSVATYTEPYSGPIWGRYQENTEVVYGGAVRNREFYHNQLRHSFWTATGFTALRGLGVMRERQINPRAVKMFDDFHHEYGHPKTREARNEYKKRLKMTFDYAMALKEKNLTGEVAA